MKTLALCFSIFFLFSLNPSLSFAEPAPTSEVSETELDQEKFKAIAAKLFEAQKLLTPEFEYAGNISLGMYFMRYLGELSPFSLQANDISELIIAIEKLYGEELNPTLKHLLTSIQKLVFRRDANKFTTIIRTKNKQDIKVPIDVQREGLVSSINDFWIKDKAEVTLHLIRNDYYRKKYYRMLSKKKEVFQLPKVHLVSEQYQNALKYYLTLEHEIPPLAGKVSGMGFNLSLNRWFPKTLRTLNLDVGEIGSFLGLKDLEGGALSPFWLSGKKWGVHVISTFDD